MPSLRAPAGAQATAVRAAPPAAPRVSSVASAARQPGAARRFGTGSLGIVVAGIGRRGGACGGARVLRVPAHPRAAAPRTAASSARAPPPPAITVSPEALRQLQRMRADRGSPEAVLRMGVKTGGCSGMSYSMDFIAPEDVRPEDSVMEAGEGLRLVCDAKALLYLFGLRLEFSDALIGGGFKFDNPNAKGGCGCGKSFKV